MNIDKMIGVAIKFIPNAAQRYPTVGDWLWRSATLRVFVSRMSKPEYCICVAVHEIVEAILCARAGVSQESVDAFDIQYEKEREAGLHPKFSEPGDDVHAPYHEQHVAATKVEMVLAQVLGVNWGAYENEINAL